MFAGRVKTILAAVALVAVVALFAFLLRGFAIGHISMGLHLGITRSGVGGEERLVVSTDGGVTWHLADNGLPNTGAQEQFL